MAEIIQDKAENIGPIVTDPDKGMILTRPQPSIRVLILMGCMYEESEKGRLIQERHITQAKDLRMLEIRIRSGERKIRHFFLTDNERG